MANRIPIPIEGGPKRDRLPRSYERWCFVAAAVPALPAIFGGDEGWWGRTATLILFGLVAVGSVLLMRGGDMRGEKSAPRGGSSRFAKTCGLVGVALVLLVSLYARFASTPSGMSDWVMKAVGCLGLGLMLVWQGMVLFGRHGVFRRSP